MAADPVCRVRAHRAPEAGGRRVSDGTGVRIGVRSRRVLPHWRLCPREPGALPLRPSSSLRSGLLPAAGEGPVTRRPSSSRQERLRVRSPLTIRRLRARSTSSFRLPGEVTQKRCGGFSPDRAALSSGQPSRSSSESTRRGSRPASDRSHRRTTTSFSPRSPRAAGESPRSPAFERTTGRTSSQRTPSRSRSREVAGASS